MKSPPVQVTDDEARDNTEEFVLKYGWKAGKSTKSAKTKTAKPKTTKKTVKKK